VKPSLATSLKANANATVLVQQLAPQASVPFRNNSRFRSFSPPTSSHRQFCLRVDADPFTDRRARLAIALTLNRPDLIKKLLVGEGTLGNDSPFWSHYPSMDPSIKQCRQNVALARSLLQATGQEKIKFTITTHRTLELPEYATAIQAAGHDAGMDISIDVQSDAEYFGGTTATTPNQVATA
jgi:peptide/nickel transport system substrate-binding protein